MNVLLHFQVRKELEDIVGSEWVSDEYVDTHPLVIDTWWAARMLEKKKLSAPEADFVVFPKNTEQVSRIMKIAQLYDMPVIPRGGSGSDTVGSIVITRGIILDIRRMNRVIEVDIESQTVKVQTGIILSELEQILNIKGYSTNHLPASMFCSTVGGFLSTRGSGVLSSKYGKIEDMVVSLNAVLPDGSVVETQPTPKSSVGPELSEVFIGSEGTIGIITEVILQIFKLPEERRFITYIFESFDSAIDVGREIMTSGLKPAVMRLYDSGDAKRMVKPVLGDVGKVEALMLFGFDGFKDVVDAEAKIAKSICENGNGKYLGTDMGMKWWNHRYDFYYPPHTLESTNFMYAVTDTIARYSDAKKLYHELKSTLETNFKEYELEFIAHMSHWYEWGTSIYPNFIIRNVPEDPYESYKLFAEVYNAATECMHRNNGCINEHHGTGFKLGRYYRDLNNSQFELLHTIKKAVDPDNILNPGKLGMRVKI